MDPADGLPRIDDNPTVDALEWCTRLRAALPFLSDPPPRPADWRTEPKILVDGTLLARLVGDREFYESEYRAVYCLQHILTATPDYGSVWFPMSPWAFLELVDQIAELGGPRYRPPKDPWRVIDLVRVVWPDVLAHRACRFRSGALPVLVGGRVYCCGQRAAEVERQMAAA